jgi:uncharacterized protein YjbJ (UPF0337 family)
VARQIGRTRAIVRHHGRQPDAAAARRGGSRAPAGIGIGIVMHVNVSHQQEVPMGREDQAAGKIKQAKGKANDVIGAARGDTGQQIKGKVQKGVGKVQAAMGKKTK